MKKIANLQDLFLLSARRARMPVTVFLVNGFQMRGIVTGERRQAADALQARDLNDRAGEPRGPSRRG